MSNCIALQFPVFQPAMRIIAAITNSNPAIVTTTFAHQYISGTIVRLDVPPADGMQQINSLTGPIVVLNTTQFSFPVDSTNFDTFAIPSMPYPPYANVCAMVVPIGEVNSQLTAAVQNVLPYKAT